MVREWGSRVGTDEEPVEIEPDPRESPYELPPVDGRPFASESERALAIYRMIEQAERERASGS
jgi:hypothetical protein